MAIDPRNYDLDELRAASNGAPWPPEGDADGGAEAEAEAVPESTSRTWPDAGGDGDDTDAADGTPDESAADAAFEASIRRDLAALERETGARQRPYLRTLPASLVAEALIFEWLEFLRLQAGRESVAEALTFYERIGWLGGDAAAALETYLSGLGDGRTNVENDLDADDHRVSLHFVARLASVSQR